MKYSVAIGSFIWVILLACNNRQEKIQPKETAITQSVYSSVIIQPDSLYDAFAAVGGILDKNLVAEGDTVSKGFPLVKIVNNTQKLSAENARLSLELAQRNFEGSAAVLRSIEDDIKTARLSLANDSINYIRQKKLWEQQIGSKLEYDTKKLNFELSKNKLVQLLGTYGRTKDQLETGLRQAKNTYNASLSSSNDFTVKSEIEGMVYAIYKSPGEVVSTLEPVAQIGSSDTFLIEMLVDEVDIVNVKLNQRVIVRLDAYTDTVFRARVSKIYPKKDQRNQTFMIEGLFEETPPLLYPGLAGEASIIIAQKPQALVIPKAYLIDLNKVQTDEGLISIELGLQNLDEVEVISGITAETWIYKPEE
ncbi:MAG: HlyD family efflux transporter periplasmic adaptor subunit [Gilvibacter sp.]